MIYDPLIQCITGLVENCTTVQRGQKRWNVVESLWKRSPTTFLCWPRDLTMLRGSLTPDWVETCPDLLWSRSGGISNMMQAAGMREDPPETKPPTASHCQTEAKDFRFHRPEAKLPTSDKNAMTLCILCSSSAFKTKRLRHVRQKN